MLVEYGRLTERMGLATEALRHRAEKKEGFATEGNEKEGEIGPVGSSTARMAVPLGWIRRR
jgi:hypothetical protein